MRLTEIMEQQELDELNLKQIGKGVAAAGLAGALALGSPGAKAGTSPDAPDVAPTGVTQQQSVDQIASKYLNYKGSGSYAGSIQQYKLEGTPEMEVFRAMEKMALQKELDKGTPRSMARMMAQVNVSAAMVAYLQTEKPDHPAIN